jgi:hypothetical protein
MPDRDESIPPRFFAAWYRDAAASQMLPILGARFDLFLLLHRNNGFIAKPHRLMNERNV